MLKVEGKPSERKNPLLEVGTSAGISRSTFEKSVGACVTSWFSKDQSERKYRSDAFDEVPSGVVPRSSSSEFVNISEEHDF